MNADLAAADTLSRRFLLDHPAEAARKIERLPRDEVAAVLSEQPTFVIVRLARYLAPDTLDELVPQLADGALAAFLVELDPGDAIAILNRFSEHERERSLALLPEQHVKALRELLEYPVGSAGRVMDPNMLALRESDTVGDALERMRRQRRKSVRQVFLIDEERHLLHTVDIQDIALAGSRERLGDLARPVRATVSPFDSREAVADLLKQFNLEVLPVVDVNERLIGVIRHAALIRALQEESAADMQTMVGASKDERALSPALFAVRKRLPWMQINLATAFLAAAVVGLFEETIAQFTALAVLLPVVAGQSGNAGAQAQAVTMRGLALREVSVRQWLRVMLKEVNVGALNGIAIAITTALGVLAWSRSFGLALVIATAMVISMLAAGVAGCLIPIGLTRAGIDPATSSSIILTTVTDIAGFMSFLGIATLLSGLL